MVNVGQAEAAGLFGCYDRSAQADRKTDDAAFARCRIGSSRV